MAYYDATLKNGKVITIGYNIRRGSPALITARAEDCYPAEADEVNIISAWHGQHKVNLSPGAIQRIKDDILSQLDQGEEE